VENGKGLGHQLSEWLLDRGCQGSNVTNLVYAYLHSKMDAGMTRRSAMRCLNAKSQKNSGAPHATTTDDGKPANNPKNRLGKTATLTVAQGAGTCFPRARIEGPRHAPLRESRS
jgi:hypothetical protein